MVLFTKPGRSGAVKTRLIGCLTAAQAAGLHTAFLEDLVERLQVGSFELRIAWALQEGDPLPAANALRQRGSDLGSRLWAGLTEAAQAADFVVAIGSDHPELTADRVEEAFAHLEEGAAGVVGPALDGGYYLIGFATGSIPQRVFEDVPWSSAEVLAVTLRRFADVGTTPAMLPPVPDVDTPADLEALAARLAARPDTSPRTAAFLRGLAGARSGG